MSSNDARTAYDGAQRVGFHVVAFLVAAWCITATAGVRSGGSYQITSEHIGPSASKSSGGGIGMTASAGAPVDADTALNGTHSIRNGFSGQQVQVTDVQFSADPTNVQEGASLPLSAPGMYDDNTMADFAGVAEWSVLLGPVTGVDGDGVAHAGNVYVDTLAEVNGSFDGFSDDVGLQVLNAGNDDFGLYAGDGVGDTWQIEFFGIDNPDGQAFVDFDGDDQVNQLEFAAMTDPTNILSRLELHIDPAGAGSVAVGVEPTYVTRDYAIEYVADPYQAVWDELVPAGIATSGVLRTYFDSNAVASGQFYRVRIDYTP